MKFLKKLAFSIVRDDIENVLKAHDKAIMDHYYKIIDDVEEILKTRNEEINAILEDKIKKLDSKHEDARADLHSEMNRLITHHTVTARDVASEIDTNELVEDLAPVVAANLNTVIALFAKWAQDNT